MSSNIHRAKLWHHNRIYPVSVKDNTLTEQTTVTQGFQLQEEIQVAM